ncbi:MAG: hypothetical protein KDA60_10980 [Planctomycetales bacterium]|nr:hypothetical protein [Planctomycetales bacterium]
MRSTPFRKLTLCLFALLAVSMAVQAQAQTVFHYNYSATLLPDIFDVGGVGNNATAGPLAVISTDIPTVGVFPTAGLHSLDSSDQTAIRANQAGAVTTAVSLLTNDLIAAAGGFTYETWFKWNGAGGVNSIIDYAGTDKLVIDQRNGASTTLAMRMDPNDLVIGEAIPGQWQYVAFVFDTNGNAVDAGTITGTATAYLDGLDPINLGTATKSNFGDSLVRPIGIGQHPIGFDLDFFDGSVFETRVSLGALSPGELLYTVPEPSCGVTLLIGAVLLGFRKRR